MHVLTIGQIDEMWTTCPPFYRRPGSRKAYFAGFSDWPMICIRRSMRTSSPSSHPPKSHQ